MISIESGELPISWPDIEFTLDQDLANQFCEVFQMPIGLSPLTMSCGAFQGMFKLLDQFQVDWLRLLHIQQNFEYKEAIELPCPVRAQSSLVRIRSRGGMTWLSFENILWDQSKTKALIVSESTILIQQEEK
jgi:hypothetical protein